MVVRLGCWHQLYVFRVAMYGGEQVTPEHDLSQARLLQHLAHCLLGLDQVNEFVGLKDAQPALLFARNAEGRRSRSTR